MQSYFDDAAYAYIAAHTQTDVLRGRHFFVTGATGMIGACLVHFLARVSGARVTAHVRDLAKARAMFGTQENVSFVVSDIRELAPEDIGADYIIHCASDTSSAHFRERPVDVMDVVLRGTRRCLAFAERNPVRKMAFLSTMEIYGQPAAGEKVDEQHSCNLDILAPRSSYPMSKRMAENLCVSYQQQYGVPVSILRLTQTFGPGVAYDDGRVFAEFARAAIEGRDIVLHTRGETERSYLYLYDACAAILTVLTQGAAGEAYNAANEATYCSIAEMAHLVTELSAQEERKIACRIKVDEAAERRFGYAPVLHMDLDTSKLQALGWRADTGLREMFSHMIQEMKRERAAR